MIGEMIMNRLIAAAALMGAALLGFANPARAQQILDPADLAAYVLEADPGPFLQSAPGLLGEPTLLFEVGTGVGVPLLLDTVPLLDVLVSNPLQLPGFLLGGGTILSPAVSAMPPIPLISAPLR